MATTFFLESILNGGKGQPIVYQVIKILQKLPPQQITAYIWANFHQSHLWGIIKVTSKYTPSKITLHWAFLIPELFLDSAKTPNRFHIFTQFSCYSLTSCFKKHFFEVPPPMESVTSTIICPWNVFVRLQIFIVFRVWVSTSYCAQSCKLFKILH